MLLFARAKSHEYYSGAFDDKQEIQSPAPIQSNFCHSKFHQEE